MSDSFWIFNWVGGGVGPDDALRRSYLPATIQGKAKLILGGVACYDPSTGLEEHTHNAGIVAALNRMEIITDFGGSSCVWLDLAEEDWDFTSAVLDGHMLHGRTLEDLIGLAASVSIEAEDRLAAYRPDAKWASDPVGAAIDTIEQVAVPAFADYYESMLTPTMSTPDDPLGFIKPNRVGLGSYADLPLIRAHDVTDTLAHPQRVADLAYDIVVAAAVGEALPGL